MELKTITDCIIRFLTKTVDEILALGVVGAYLVGKFVAVEIPIELPAGILAYYFVRNQ